MLEYSQQTQMLRSIFVILCWNAPPPQKNIFIFIITCWNIPTKTQIAKEFHNLMLKYSNETRNFENI